MEEIWKKIINHPNYEISNYRIIRDINTKKVKSQSYSGRHHYPTIWLDAQQYRVHRLVAEYFVEKPKDYTSEYIVNHIDENKNNNRADNLEWCTILHNNNHGTRNERIAKTESKGKVYKYDDNGNIIQEFISLNSIKKYTNSGAAIAHAIQRNTFNRYFDDGYWFKENESFDNSRKKLIKKYNLIGIHTNKIYASGTSSDISKALNIPLYKLSNAIVSKKYIVDKKYKLEEII